MKRNHKSAAADTAANTEKGGGPAQRVTKQRTVVQHLLDNAGRPLSPAEVYEQARTNLPSISLATVYRTLRTLCEDGALTPVAVPGAPDRYETSQRAQRHHHHFLCDDCQRVFDIPGCGLRSDTKLPAGFSLSRHEVMLYGRCSECTN